MVAKQFTASKDKGSDIRATKTTKVMVSAEETTKTKTAMKRTDVLSDAEIERVGDLGSMIAEEMNALSLKEREDVYEQVHGVDPPVDETKEFVSKCLMALDKEIKEIPVKPAYDQAIGENREYVEDPKLRLAFLRAESYNAKRAAIRFVKFMDGKLEYFGPECLTRRIHLSDLDEDAVAVIKSGCMQLLPDRDRAGRAVVCDMHPVIPNAHKQGIDLLRAVFYFLLSVADDEETQRCGLVIIWYFIGKFHYSPERDQIEKGAALMDFIPLKIAGIHQCTDNPILQGLSSLLLLGLGKERRARTRLHFGSHQECQYTLMTFGLPVQFIPVNYEGQLKTANHLKWISVIQKKEKCMKEGEVFKGVTLPRQDDVLLFRGKRFQDHAGNVKMRTFVESLFAEYRKANGNKKSSVTMKVIWLVRASGGRFLTLTDDEFWVEVTDDFAKKKVATSFRNPKLTQGRVLQQQQQQQKSLQFNHQHLFGPRPTKKIKRNSFGRPKNPDASCFSITVGCMS